MLWWWQDDILTWHDTGQQWEVCWTQKDFDDFCAMDFDSQCGLLEQLEEMRS